ncbi:MAG: fluoride efflux transporter FluC [Actinomycetota bacterium]
MRSASVVVGGVLGTLARWWIGEVIPTAPGGFPWETLLVNVTGAFMLGLIGVVLIERVARIGHLRSFLAIGLLGSYTTFSTMALEGVQLIEARLLGLATGYWIATLVVGQMAAALGMWLGRSRNPLRKERR